MGNNIVLILVLFFLGCLAFCVYYITRYNRLKQTFIRSRFEDVCRFLHVDGYPRRVDYTEIPRLYYVYKQEKPEEYLFVDIAVSAIVKQIKQYPTFEKVIDHLMSFDLLIVNSKTKEEDKDLVKKIHTKVAEATIHKVGALAQRKAHYLRALSNSGEKIDLEYRFKQELSLVAITNYYPRFSYDFFMGIEKQKLLDARKKKNEAIVEPKIEEAKVIELSKAATSS